MTLFTMKIVALFQRARVSNKTCFHHNLPLFIPTISHSLSSLSHTLSPFLSLSLSLSLTLTLSHSHSLSLLCLSPHSSLFSHFLSLTYHSLSAHSLSLSVTFSPNECNSANFTCNWNDSIKSNFIWNYTLFHFALLSFWTGVDVKVSFLYRNVIIFLFI